MIELLGIITAVMLGIMALSGILYVVFCYLWNKKDIDKLEKEEQEYAIVHAGPSDPLPEEKYGKSVSMAYNKFFNKTTGEFIDPKNYMGFIVRGEAFSDIDIHNDSLIFTRLEFKPEELTVPNYVVILKNGFYYLREVVKVNKRTITIKPIGNENKIVYFKNIFGQVDYDFNI